MQKLMLRSRANTLLSVRRVTERNAGRLTAGVDGEVVLTPEAKARLVERVQQQAEPFKALPVRRVYIPKRGSSTKRRPLGIPVIARPRATRHGSSTRWSPSGRRRFEPRSYGFRPGRGCQDAIQAVYEVVKGKSPKRPWVLDADLAGAFDRIAHDHILAMLGSFPARGMVAQWLKAGVVEQGRLHRTEEGTPQGGVVSPVLLNVALHGMETGRRSPLPVDAGWIRVDSPVLIRYADDFVVLCHTRQDALEVKAQLADVAGAQGPGFQRGQDARRHPRRGLRLPGIQRPPLRRQAADQTEQGGRQTDPGTAPHRAAVPARDQRSGGDQTAQPDHPGMGGLLPDTGIQRDLRLAGSIPVAAHLQVGQVQPREQADALGHRPVLRPVQQGQAGPVGVRRPQQRRLPAQVLLDPPSSDTRSSTARASPDDPALADYWAKRRRKTPLPIDKTSQGLIKAQDGRCPICRTRSFAVATSHKPRASGSMAGDHAQTIITIASGRRHVGEAEPRLIHADCRNRVGPALLPAYEPSGLA